ncbi:MAG: hypothetical protein GXO58_09510 [Thermodesulfobacteria bacterium]|nr:hypothetical protein [Thermodesulfobacteriota bacterium]
MRQYVVDELRSEEIEKITSYLEKSCERSALDNLFWLKLPDDILTPTQYGHKDCGPFCVGIEVTEDKMIIEMLIRSRKKLRCNCISYATNQQRQFILNFADTLLKEAGIEM